MIKAAFAARMCSCSNIPANMLLDKTLQLLEVLWEEYRRTSEEFKAAKEMILSAQKEEEEERILSAQKLDEDLDELSEERDQEDHMHGR